MLVILHVTPMSLVGLMMCLMNLMALHVPVALMTAVVACNTTT